MTLLTSLLALLRGIPGLGRLLQALGLVAGTAVVMRREQAHAQEMADVQGKLTRAEADLAARSAGRDANLRWMRENRPKSVQPIKLERD